MKVYIVYDWMIDWDWNVQKVFYSEPKAKKWMKDNQSKYHPCVLLMEEAEVE